MMVCELSIEMTAAKAIARGIPRAWSCASIYSFTKPLRGLMATKIISALQNSEFRHALKELYKRAATDPDFRQLALQDPAAAFQEVNYTIRDWSIQFVEPKEGVDDVLQLPPAIEVTPELSEEELEAVAGGAMDGCCIIVSCSNVSDAVADSELKSA